MRCFKNRRAQTTRRGYLLLEVLLSLVILSAGLVLISRSFISSISATGLLKNHFQAVVLLESKLAEVETGLTDLPQVSGDMVEGDDGGFHWSIQDMGMGFEEPHTASYSEFLVSISWVEKGKERVVASSLGLTQQEKGRQ